MGTDERLVSKSTVVELGEFGLIDRLGRLLGGADRDPLRPPSDGEIVLGDDAALWQPTPGRSEVLTTDALVEGVHFRLQTTDWRDLGWKALAANLSDVAAMGARPRRAFITIGVPGQTRIADLEALYEGIHDLADRYEVVVAGGDTVTAPLVLLSVSVVGELKGPGLRRGAAQAGDLLAVTGPLGASAGGLELLESGGSPRDDDERTLAAAHRRPEPRVREGLLLVEAGVRCGMDLSDGLLGDATKLAHASDLGAMLDRDGIPVHPALERRFGDRARDLALAGGEDYELLIAAPTEVLERASRALAAAGLRPLTLVGGLTSDEPSRVRVVDRTGQVVRSPARSWDHFARTTEE